MSCDDHAIVANQDMVHQPELRNRARGLRRMVLGVRSGFRACGIRRSSGQRSMRSLNCDCMLQRSCPREWYRWRLLWPRSPAWARLISAPRLAG
jgi:hypothetical protein